MKLKIHPDAEEDLVQGFQFYEEKCPGLGGEFLQYLDNEIRRSPRRGAEAFPLCDLLHL